MQISVKALFDQLRGLHAQMCCDPLKGQQGDVLLAAFHRADMGTVDIHRRRQRSLRQRAFLAVVLQIPCKNNADVHPQVKSLSRILVRRIIMLIWFLSDRDPVLHAQIVVFLWV